MSAYLPDPDASTVRPATNNLCDQELYEVVTPYKDDGLSTDHIRPHSSNSALKTASDSPSITFTDGGSVTSLTFGSHDESRRSVPPRSWSRGKVSGLSRSSRRTLLRVQASIDRIALKRNGVRLFLLTLTLPSEICKTSAKECKRFLSAFRRRMERRFGQFSAVWRLGVQRRGAFHFHIVMYLPVSPRLLPRLREFVAEAWYEVCGWISEGHLKAGTNVSQVRRSDVTSYAERYLARPEEALHGLATGRVWGTWRRQLLPISHVTVAVSLSDAMRIRRVLRRAAERRSSGRLTTLTVFVRSATVARLLASLGYRIE